MLSIEKLMKLQQVVNKMYIFLKKMLFSDGLKLRKNNVFIKLKVLEIVSRVDT